MLLQIILQYFYFKSCFLVPADGLRVAFIDYIIKSLLPWK
jgi:hypothetical protein